MSGRWHYNMLGNVYVVAQIGLGNHLTYFKSLKKACVAARTNRAERGGDWKVTRHRKPGHGQSKIVFRTDRCGT